MRVIREGTAKFMSDNFGISSDTTEVLFDAGLLREDIARRVLIRDEYQAQCQPGKKTKLKYHLAEKYAVSTSTVEKILSQSI